MKMSIVRCRVGWRRWLGVCLLTSAMGSSAVAHADEAKDPVAARALFNIGRKLMDQGDFAAACPKLADSYRLDPGSGTKFNLAHCYEKQGRTATAWALFLEVAAETKKAGDAKREKTARQRAAALEPTLAKLTIVVPAEMANLSGLTITRDGTPVGRATWGTPLPIDPGDHSIEVKASGKEPWKTHLQVDKGAMESTTIPPLTDAAEVAAPPDATAEAFAPLPATESSARPSADAGATSTGSTQRIIGLVVGGAGVVTVGIGGLVGLGAKSTYDDSSSHCVGNLCDQAGVDLRSDARSKGNLATIVTGVGLAALAGGAILYFTAPSGTSTAVRSAPQVGVGPGAVVVRGVW